MIPTYVFGWPSGEETGEFLAVDLGMSPYSSHPFHVLITYHLGGTNLRVCLVKLNGNGKFEITQSKYRLTEEQKQEDGEKLFDFCGKCLKAFTDSIQESGELPKDKLLPLGFTVCRFNTLLSIPSNRPHPFRSSHTPARE